MASSRSFKTTPCLFSIPAKKCGNNAMITEIIAVPLTIRNNLGEVLNSSFQRSFIDKLILCATVLITQEGAKIVQYFISVN